VGTGGGARAGACIWMEETAVKKLVWNGKSTNILVNILHQTVSSLPQ
jgi:hypothetical protein